MMFTVYKNVVGIGQGYKNQDKRKPLAVVFMVKKKLPVRALAPEDLIPREINGRVTDVIQVGEVRALAIDPKSKIRPAPGGSSIGHYKITAGTLGGIVTDPVQGRLILSNNHVLANSNDAEIGDPIYQPGPYDGGGLDDQIATLHDFVPIDFGVSEPTCALANFYAWLGNGIASLVGSKHRVEAFYDDAVADNFMDAALAKPISPVDDMVTDEVLEIGKITGASETELGMMVRKSGRTTGLTEGKVIVMDAIIEVSYGDGKVALFRNQIVTSAMSQGGDSGSLLVELGGTNAVGLLFAGSDEATIHSPIKPILDHFGVSFV